MPRKVHITHLCLTHDLRKIVERGQARVQDGERQATPIQRTRYDPALESQGPDTAAIKKAEEVSTQYFQLKPWHGIMGTYLQPIRKTEND